MKQYTLPFGKYPDYPGYKREGTSSDAAKCISYKVKGLRKIVLDALTYEPMTSDEVAHATGKRGFSVRPRITELFKMGLIKDTGVRRMNDSGVLATVWAAK